MSVKKANGEGSINKYKNGWRATITLGRDDNGKLIRKQFYGKTKMETLKKVEEFKSKHNAGLLPLDEKITLQEWVNIYLFQYRINDLKPASLERYEGIYRNYILNSPIGIIKLKDLRGTHIQSYYNYLILECNKTPEVIRSLNKLLKAALNKAEKETYIQKNYCANVTLPSTSPKDEVEIFTMEEQMALINSISDHRHKALILTVLGTGIRLGEVVALKWEDINFKTGSLKIRRTFKRVSIIPKPKEGPKTKLIEQIPKTKNSIRDIPIPSNIIEELKHHKKRQNIEIIRAGEGYIKNDLIFPNELGHPTDDKNLVRSYRRILAKANIRYKKFHSLRHTYATRLFEKGVPLKTVSELLGHSTIKVTADTYTHVLNDEKFKAVEKINELFKI